MHLLTTLSYHDHDHDNDNDMLISLPIYMYMNIQLPAGWVWIYNINPVPKGVFACIDPQYQFVSNLIKVPSASLSGSLQSGLTTFQYVPTNTFLSTYVFAMENGSYCM